MKRTWANLKVALSQPWAIWTLFACAVGVYGILFVWQTLAGWNGGGGIWVASWLWANLLLNGVILMGAGGRASHDDTVLFHAPGVSGVPARSSLGRAVRVGVAFSLVLFSNAWHRMYLRADWPPGMPQPSLAVGAAIPELSLTVVGAFLAGMAICLLWIGGGVIMCWRTWLAVLFLGMGIAIGHVAWSPASRHAFTIWPVLIPLSLLLCAYLWRRLGDREWVKSGHRAIILYRIKVARGAEVRTAVSSWVEEFFLSRMRKGGSMAPARQLWGWLYRGFGPILSRWKWIVGSLLVGALVLGYLNRFFASMAFVLLGMYMTGSVWLASSTMPLPEGRREKCYLTIASGALATLLLMGVSAGVVLLSWVLAALATGLSGDIPPAIHGLQYEECLAGVSACAVVFRPGACPCIAPAQHCARPYPL